jgi:hypothetical protein
MNRAERRRLERRPVKINKNSLEYREGIKEGIRQERGRFVEAMENAKGIGDKLIERVLGEVVKLYK